MKEWRVWRIHGASWNLEHVGTVRARGDRSALTAAAKKWGKGRYKVQLIARRNPDERLRRLERLAATGDEQARLALRREEARAGIPVPPERQLGMADVSPAAIHVARSQVGARLDNMNDMGEVRYLNEEMDDDEAEAAHIQDSIEEIAQDANAAYEWAEWALDVEDDESGYRRLCPRCGAPEARFVPVHDSAGRHSQELSHSFCENEHRFTQEELLDALPDDFAFAVMRAFEAMLPFGSFVRDGVPSVGRRVILIQAWEHLSEEAKGQAEETYGWDERFFLRPRRLVHLNPFARRNPCAPCAIQGLAGLAGLAMAGRNPILHYYLVSTWHPRKDPRTGKSLPQRYGGRWRWSVRYKDDEGEEYVAGEFSDEATANIWHTRLKRARNWSEERAILGELDPHTRRRGA